MKQLLMLAFFAMSLKSCASCSKNTSPANNNRNPTGSKMKIKIGNSAFTATLYDNATTTSFKSLLPLTVNMIELNGNEKYFDLPRSLPTNASNSATQVDTFNFLKDCISSLSVIAVKSITDFWQERQ